VYGIGLVVMTANRFGLLQEFRWLVFAFILLPINVILSGVAPHGLAMDTTILLAQITFSYFICWCSTCLWPLYLSYRHQRTLEQRLVIVTHQKTRLPQLLMVKEGFDAFLSFAKDEFNSEPILFWSRIHHYRNVQFFHPSLTLINVDDNDERKKGPLANDPGVAGSVEDDGSSPNNGPGSSRGLVKVSPRVSSISWTAKTPQQSLLPVHITTEQAQLHLLSTLIEATDIFAHYIDIGAPYELKMDPATRTQIRATIETLKLRAAIAGIVTLSSSGSVTPTATTSDRSLTPLSPIPSQQSCTGNGITISGQLSIEDAIQLEVEARTMFSPLQESIINVTEVTCYQRFRISDNYMKLVAMLSGVMVEVNEKHHHPHRHQITPQQQRQGIQVPHHRPAAAPLVIHCRPETNDIHHKDHILHQYDTVANIKRTTIAPTPLPLKVTPVATTPLVPASVGIIQTANVAIVTLNSQPQQPPQQEQRLLISPPIPEMLAFGPQISGISLSSPILGGSALSRSQSHQQSVVSAPMTSPPFGAISRVAASSLSVGAGGHTFYFGDEADVLRLGDTHMSRDAHLYLTSPPSEFLHPAQQQSWYTEQKKKKQQQQEDDKVTEVLLDHHVLPPTNITTLGCRYDSVDETSLDPHELLSFGHTTTTAVIIATNGNNEIDPLPIESQ
jgi:hypothetical protein